MIGIGDGATVGHSARGQSEESAIQFRYKADYSIRPNAVVSELSRSLLEFKNIVVVRIILATCIQLLYLLVEFDYSSLLAQMNSMPGPIAQYVYKLQSVHKYIWLSIQCNTPACV